jgi:hypothetical protein
MKGTAKSCSCYACKRGKSSQTQKVLMKKTERGFRHQQKIALKKGSEDVGIAPYGGYTD